MNRLGLISGVVLLSLAAGAHAAPSGAIAHGVGSAAPLPNPPPRGGREQGEVIRIAASSTPARRSKAKAAAPRVFTITVDKLAFGPAPSGLKVGDVVEWANKDIFQHSATAKDKSFDVELKAGGKGRTVLRKAGSINYICRYHPGMTGVLTVRR